MKAPPHEELDRLSRELAFACDRAGIVTWVDARARRLLRLEPGVRLRDRVPVGAEEKLGRLFERAPQERVEGWELLVDLDGRPVAMAFSTAPWDGGVLFTGSLVPEDYGQALTATASMMSELSSLHRELSRVNQELEESNRGVQSLYAELDERAEMLRRDVEAKTRMVSHVSHEFRTPINSMQGLARLLLKEADGPLNGEQRKQVGFVLRAADEMAAMVDDLLDLARVQAGRTPVRLRRFQVNELLAALRGSLRPLASRPEVALVVEDVPEDVELETDEGKIAQVLRNLVSNALKFTEQGEVRVAVSLLPDDQVCFQVIDTGIGIPPELQEKVFQEFGQLDGPLQRQVKGTGLGLSLSRGLAELLGGALTLKSVPGEGSTFTFVVPRFHPDAAREGSGGHP